MTVQKLKFPLIIFLAAASIAILSAFNGRISKISTSGNRNMPPAIDSVSAASIVARPETSVASPNGKSILTMSTKNAGEEKIWKVAVDGKTIMEESLPPVASISLPFNTFSPDNKYIFIKKEDADFTYYNVFKTNGEPMSEDFESLDVGSFFASKFKDFIITDITGWAGNVLLVVNTNTTSGEKGPSFWFNVSSKTTTRLSTRFD